MHIDPLSNGLSPLATPADQHSLVDRSDVRPVVAVQPVARDLAGNTENKLRTAPDTHDRRRPHRADGHTDDTQAGDNTGSEDGHIDIYV